MVPPLSGVPVYMKGAGDVGFQIVAVPHDLPADVDAVGEAARAES